MVTRMSLKRPISEPCFSKIEGAAEIYIYSAPDDLNDHCKKDMDMDSSTVFGLWINHGDDNRPAIMFDVEINELELFARSLLNHISIIRDNY